MYVDTADGGIPVNCVRTAASVQESQVANLPAILTATRVTSCSDLMDSTHDAGSTKQHSRYLNHVPIIAIKPRATPGLGQGKARTLRREPLGRTYSLL